jgi:hypothetical protein
MIRDWCSNGMWIDGIWQTTDKMPIGPIAKMAGYEGEKGGGTVIASTEA